jgi:hypothetical protein
MNPTVDEMRAAARRQFDGFRDRYGYQPLSHRGHCCIWVGWVEQARILSENGVRLDSNHYPYTHHQYGFLSGSGRAFRFVDEQGAPLDLWEQPTLMSDDCMLQDKTAIPPFSVDEAIDRSRELIDALADRWHGVYHPCFHPIYMRTDWQYPYTAPWIEAVAAHCRERGVPMVSAEEWAAFLLGRRSVRLLRQEQPVGNGRCAVPSGAAFGAAVAPGTTCRERTPCRSFELQASQPVPNLALLLPPGFVQASVNGTPVPSRSCFLEGRERQVLICDMPAGVPVSLVLDREGE